VVAAGVEAEVLAVEAQCERLVRRGEFLQASGGTAWPDGTVAAQYGFRHVLYQQVVYERLPAARRQHLHQQIGARLEQAYGERTSEIATALAMHRQQAGDAAQAVRYRGLAAQKANRRSAPREAIEHVTQALRLLKTLPDTRERTGLELRLHLTLLPALLTLRGFASPEVARTCTRAQELWRALGKTLPLSPAQLGLWREFYWVGPLALPFA
jgi:predicted ATPase